MIGTPQPPCCAKRSGRFGDDSRHQRTPILAFPARVYKCQMSPCRSIPRLGTSGTRRSGQTRNLWLGRPVPPSSVTVTTHLVGCRICAFRECPGQERSPPHRKPHVRGFMGVAQARRVSCGANRASKRRKTRFRLPGIALPLHENRELRVNRVAVYPTVAGALLAQIRKWTQNPSSLTITAPTLE